MWRLLIGFVCLSTALADPIPPKAEQYLPMLSQTLDAYFPDIPKRGYPGALIELESCISFDHPRCWDPTASFKTRREMGVGFGMVTKTYGRHGYDSLAGMRRKYRDELRDLSWSNITHKPDLQLRMMVLMIRDLYRQFYAVNDPFQRLAFSDAAYNGGFSGVEKERRYCRMKSGCDAQYWFDHVEHTCLKSRKPLYGRRSACDINRNHVQETLRRRLDKYEQVLERG